MTRDPSNTLATMLCAVAAAASLAACDRPADDRTAGQKIDSTVAQMERKADEAAADARAAGQDAQQAAGSAMDAIADKAKDATITATINAELAKDSQLSALQVDVDTVDGRVVLRGTAPDTASRDRATVLAQRVQGVKSVDNQLNVSPKKG
jgi:osmotically-inducible protein OsmY